MQSTFTAVLPDQEVPPQHLQLDTTLQAQFHRVGTILELLDHYMPLGVETGLFLQRAQYTGDPLVAASKTFKP